MNTVEMLDQLQNQALKDFSLREKLLNTEHLSEPLDEFCKICRTYGYEIYPMDVIIAGEESYAAMKRSTNGGGENAPMLDGEDDFYELFLAALKTYPGL